MAEPRNPGADALLASEIDYSEMPPLEKVPDSMINTEIMASRHECFTPDFRNIEVLIEPASPTYDLIEPERIMQYLHAGESHVSERPIIDEWTGKPIDVTTADAARAIPYGATFASPNVVVGIAGIIGAGKSTLASALAKKFGWDCIDEPVSENPYLADFYKDKAKYGFAMQIFLLHHRFRQHQSMVWGKRSAIQDRTIYEDVIFAKMLHESGDISDRDFATYCSAFDNMSNFLHRPDIIVYLDVTPEVAHDRVVARARGCETGLVPIEYLRALRDGYEDWLSSGIRGRIPVLRMDWNGAIDIDGVAEKISAILESMRTSFII